MKSPRKARIIGLSGLLVIMIALAGVAIWRVSTPKEQNQDTLLPQQTDVNEPDKIYMESLMLEMQQGKFSDLSMYGDKVVARMCNENSDNIVDVNTGEPILELPKEWSENGQVVCQIAFDSNKNLYGAIYDKDSKALTVKKHSADGSQPAEAILLRDFNCATHKDGNPYVDKLVVDDAYIYLLYQADAEHKNIQIYTIDGEKYIEYEDMVDFDIDGKGAIFCLHKVNTDINISKRDVTNRSTFYTFTAKENLGVGLPKDLVIDKNSGLLYLGTTSSVLTYKTEDGAYVDTIMDMAVSAPSLNDKLPFDMVLPRMALDGEHNLYFMNYTDADIGKVQFYKYMLGENLRKNMPYTLTVTAPYRDDFMAKAIAQFEMDYPGQKVKYDFTYTGKMEFGMNADRDGYFDRNDIRLMTGDIGDIVMSSETRLDIWQLTKADVFEDLKPLIEKGPSFNELDKQMLDGVTVDGQIQCLPLAGIYCYAQVNESLCKEMGIDLDWNTATWSDVLGLLDKFEGTDKHLFSMFGNTERAFIRMLISNMPDVIDRENKKVDLRQPWFLDLIEQWNKAEKNPNFATFNMQKGLVDNALVCIDMKTEDFFDDSLPMFMIKFKTDTGDDMRLYPLFCGEKNVNRTGVVNDLYSISAGSKNKEMAWALLSRAMKEDMQSQRMLRNRSINLTARNKKIAASELETIGEKPEFEKEIKICNNDLKKIYTAVDEFYDMSMLKEDLFRPIVKYFSGSVTLDVALNEAERNIWTRINE